MEREFGWLLDPLTKGDYPDSLKQSIGSDLPTFTEQEKADLKGSIDFIGVNVYTARYVRNKAAGVWQLWRLTVFVHVMCAYVCVG